MSDGGSGHSPGPRPRSAVGSGLADAAIVRAAAFLEATQDSDGLWRDFVTPAGEATTWPTAYVATSLTEAAGVSGSTARAASALADRQHRDGGWGYHEATPSDADSTSWAVLLLARTGMHPEALPRAAAFLARHQRPSGGVATYAESAPIRDYTGLPRWVPFRGWCRPHLEVSATTGRAFASLGTDDAASRAAAAWRYVAARQGPDGGWNSYWWTSPHLATREAAALGARFGDRKAVQAAAAWARRGQRDDGAWALPGEDQASAWATALGTAVLATAGRPHPALALATQALVHLQQGDGGWPGGAQLRIPVPADASLAGDHRRRVVRFTGGIVVGDHRRAFTSATCLGALTAACRAGDAPPAERSRPAGG